MNKNFKFLGLLLGVLLVVFGLHLVLLNAYEKPLFEHKIVLSYLVNYALAVIVLVLVQRSMKENSAKAGMIFFVGSALKFLVFFLVFHRSYKADGEVQTIEFITFFVPYAICLVMEVYYLSKQLNNQSYPGHNSE